MCKLSLQVLRRSCGASLAIFLIATLCGCATPVHVVERNMRLAQEVDQACETVDELFFAPQKSSDLLTEIQARLRLRFTGTTCQIVGTDAETGGALVLVDRKNCPGFIAFNNHALVGGIDKAGNELRKAILNDRDSLDRWVGDNSSELTENVKALDAALNRLSQTLGASKEFANLRASITELEATVGQLAILARTMAASAISTRKTLQRQLDTLKSNTGTSAKLVWQIESALQSYADRLEKQLNTGQCTERTKCARAIVLQLAELSSSDTKTGIAKSLTSLQETARQIAETLGAMGQTIASDPLPKLWANSGPERVRAVHRDLQTVWSSTNEARHSAAAIKEYKNVQDAVSKVAELGPLPLLDAPSKYEELRNTLSKAEKIVAAGLKSNAKLAAGDVASVAGELFGDYAQYSVAEKGLRLAERALAPVDRLVEKFDDKFYLAGSVALVWNEEPIQRQFDLLYKSLRDNQLTHPRFELAFASAACRRLDERNAPSSQFAPFLHRSLVNGIPQSLCKVLPADLSSAKKPTYCTNLQHGNEKKLECGGESDSAEWSKCLQRRGVELAQLAQYVRSEQVKDKKDLDDLQVTQICALSADAANSAPGGASKAAICDSVVANAVQAEQGNPPHQLNQPGQPKTAPKEAVDAPPEAPGIAALAAKDKEKRDDLAKNNEASKSHSGGVPASKVAEATSKDARQMQQILDAKATGLESSPTHDAKSSSASRENAGTQPAPSQTTLTKAVLPSVLPRCADFERRHQSLRCYEQDGQLTAHFPTHFKSGEWHDPAIEEVLSAIAELASFNRKKIKAEVAGGASSKRLRCSDIVPSRASTSVARSVPPEVSVESGSAPANRVTLKYRSPRTQTDTPFTSAVVNCSSNDGNSILAYFRAAWAASVLERASNGTIQIDGVGIRSLRPALGYDSQWDRTVTVTLRPASGTP